MMRHSGSQHLYYCVTAPCNNPLYHCRNCISSLWMSSLETRKIHPFMFCMPPLFEKMYAQIITQVFFSCPLLKIKFCFVFWRRAVKMGLLNKPFPSNLRRVFWIIEYTRLLNWSLGWKAERLKKGNNNSDESTSHRKALIPPAGEPNMVFTLLAVVGATPQQRGVGVNRAKPQLIPTDIFLVFGKNNAI